MAVERWRGKEIGSGKVKGRGHNLGVDHLRVICIFGVVLIHSPRPDEGCYRAVLHWFPNVEPMQPFVVRTLGTGCCALLADTTLAFVISVGIAYATRKVWWVWGWRRSRSEV